MVWFRWWCNFQLRAHIEFGLILPLIIMFSNERMLSVLYICSIAVSLGVGVYWNFTVASLSQCQVLVLGAYFLIYCETSTAVQKCFKRRKNRMLFITDFFWLPIFPIFPSFLKKVWIQIFKLEGFLRWLLSRAQVTIPHLCLVLAPYVQGSSWRR